MQRQRLLKLAAGLVLLGFVVFVTLFVLLPLLFALVAGAVLVGALALAVGIRRRGRLSGTAHSIPSATISSRTLR